ncbi:MAG: gene transfer agent family protein [Pseudomonadota bacterium]
MINPHRGDVEVILDGTPRRLCLTLGALAELEHVFGVDDLVALAERFEAGRFTSNDLVAILTAGLRGGGADLSPADVARMSVDGGAAATVRAVSGLLRATFGSAEAETSTPDP